MKALIKRARKLHDDLQLEAHKRRESFLKRSEKFQESEEGDLYGVVTDSLEELAQFIDEGLSNFDESA